MTRQLVDDLLFIKSNPYLAYSMRVSAHTNVNITVSKQGCGEVPDFPTTRWIRIFRELMPEACSITCLRIDQRSSELRAIMSLTSTGRGLLQNLKGLTICQVARPMLPPLLRE